MRRPADEKNWIGVNISGENINNLRYADDIVLISASVRGLQDLLNEVERVSSELCLEFSTKKTKVMAATCNPVNLDIRCRGTKQEQVAHINYLGAMVEDSGDIHPSILHHPRNQSQVRCSTFSSRIA